MAWYLESRAGLLIGSAMSDEGRPQTERIVNLGEPSGGAEKNARPPIQIRRAEPADLKFVDEIQRACYPAATQWPLAAFLQYEAWVAVAGTEVVGFILYRAVAPDEGEVLNLAVAPAYRRRGVARKLLQHVLECHPGSTYLEVRRSNIAARKLYETQGFEVVGIRPGYYRDPVEDAIVMRFRSC